MNKSYFYLNDSGVFEDLSQDLFRVTVSPVLFSITSKQSDISEPEAFND